MTHASVFSGIGGPEVAAAMLGWENLFHCEINPFGRAVLDYWFPNSKSYEDITKTDFSEWQGKVNVLTGGFPCQPFSYAGQRRGSDDDRYLWPFMHRCINQVRPDWVVCENVAGILTMVEQGDVTEMATEKSLFDEGDTLYRYRLEETFTLERICNDLEGDGYAVQAVVIPACAVNAPHRRDRVFIIGCRNDITDPSDTGLQETRPEQQAAGDRGFGLRDGSDAPYPDCNRGSKEESGVCVSDPIRTGLERQDQPRCGKGGQRVHLRRDPARCHRQDDQERTTAPGTNSNGQCSCCRPSGRAREKMDSRGAGKPFNGIERLGASRPVTDTTGNGSDRIATGESGQAARQDGQLDAEPAINGGVLSKPSADTESQQGGRLRPEQPECGEPQQGELGGRNQQDGRGGYAPNTRCTGLEECQQLTSDMGKEDCRRQTGGHCDGGVQGREFNHWADFPTVSPVHRGNDGLPFPLDDLTIPASKWRTESLKAYGNAIVPQVMYEIFRAIESTYQ